MAALTNGPGLLRTASLTPALGALTTVVGSADGDNANATTGAVSIGNLSLLMLRMTYARHASSTTGRPIVRIDLSMDAADTAPGSVANWQPVMLMDAASFSLGAVELYVEQQRLNPSASGSSTFGTHPVNVACAVWVRVQVGDEDTTNPGSFTGIAYGGAT